MKKIEIDFDIFELIIGRLINYAEFINDAINNKRSESRIELEGYEGSIKSFIRNLLDEYLTESEKERILKDIFDSRMIKTDIKKYLEIK